MKCLRIIPFQGWPGTLLPVGPFPFIVGDDVVVTAAVRNTEVLKRVITEDAQLTFKIGSIEDLERVMIGAGTCLPDGRVIDWRDDLRTIVTPEHIRAEVATALRDELSKGVDTTRPGFLQLLAALWGAEDQLAEQKMRDEIAREFGRRLEGTASIHDLANHVTFPVEMPWAQRLAFLKSVIDRLVDAGKLRKVNVADDQRDYGEYDVPYELT